MRCAVTVLSRTILHRSTKHSKLTFVLAYASMMENIIRNKKNLIINRQQLHQAYILWYILYLVEMFKYCGHIWIILPTDV